MSKALENMSFDELLEVNKKMESKLASAESDNSKLESDKSQLESEKNTLESKIAQLQFQVDQMNRLIYGSKRVQIPVKVDR